MLRSRLCAWTSALSLAVVYAAPGAIIESTPVELRSKGDPLVFDFTAAPGLSSITIGSKLVGLDAAWQFFPGAGASGSVQLAAGLAIPSLLSGDKTDVGFDVTVGPGLSTTASPASANEDGLPYGPTVIGALLNDVVGKLNAELYATGTDFVPFDEFFEDGGSLVVKLKLTTGDPSVGNPGGSNGPGGGGGNPVPEPSSLVIWLAPAAILLLRQRRRALPTK